MEVPTSSSVVRTFGSAEPRRNSPAAARIDRKNGMRRLSDLRDDDALSEVLRAVRVRSTIWCVSVLRAPWAFGVAPREAASFHLVLAGGGWLEVDGIDGRSSLATGDLVVLAHGNGHAVSDDPATPVTLLDDLLERSPARDGRLAAGGAGEPSELLCGGFVLEGQSASPLLALLPTVLHVRGPAEWLDGTSKLIRHELPAYAPGADAVVTRLTDVLLTQALRHHLAGRDDVRALRDPWIAGVVRMLNDQPERRWSVADLASAAALSRSAFRERFRELTGEPPMRYLTRLRLARAAALLRDSDLGLYEIARRCGYESEPSLSRAFKRAFGVSPGRYRRDGREAADLVTAARPAAG
jgi:AraC-like DNA-binding protein